MLPDKDTGLSWYALRVKSNFEQISSVALNGMGYEQYSPFYRTRRRWSDRVKEIDAPLFPGYIFARFDPQNRLPILKAPGVVEIVGSARQPVPVSESEIETVRRILRSEASCGPWPFLQSGQHVRIERGALAGVEGILLEVKTQFRLIVSISILQRSVGVEIERNSIRPISAPKMTPRSEATSPLHTRVAR